MINSSHPRRSRRIGTVAFAAVLALVASVLTACSSSGDSGKSHLVVGYSPVFGFLNVAAARNVQPKGVTVEYKKFTDFSDLVSALTSGNLDLAEVGDVTAVSAFAAGADIRVVASTASNARAAGFMVGPKSKARSFKDLVGQKIAFNKATNAYPNFLGAIAAEGLKPSDFKLVQFTSSADRDAALLDGDIAAKDGIQPSEANFFLLHGGHQIVSGEGYIQNYYPYVAPTKVVKEKSAALAAFLVQLRSTIKWAVANPEAHAKLVAPALGVSEQAIISGYALGAKDLTPLDATYKANVQKVVDVFLKNKILTKQPDLNVLFDNQFAPKIFGKSA